MEHRSGTARIDGGELVVRTLLRAGVEHVFALHGGHLEPILQSCVAHGIRLIDTRHEAAAGHAANGYARATGRPGIALVTAGPGLTNVVTALADGLLDGIPLLVITGAAPLRDAETNPLQGGLDQIALVRPVTKWAHRITDVHRIPALVAQAVRTATSGRPGPVVLEIPVDVLFRQVNETAARIPNPARALPPAPGAGSVGKVIELLALANRPVIMAGTGVLLSRSGELLTELAEITGTPVLTNCKAHGVIATDHPLCGHDFVTLQHLEGFGPDMALMLGARLGRYTGGVTDALLPFEAKLAVVDIDAAEIAKVRDVEVAIHADCREALEQLVAAARERAWPERARWQFRVSTAAGWHRRRFASALSKDLHPIHPYRAAHEVMLALDNPIVVTDGGDATSWTEMTASISGHGAYMVTGYLGCLGTGLPYALGAKVAHPDRQVVCITGDGALGFNIQEFDTLVRHGLAVITVVMNNKSWGMSRHGQVALYGNRPGVIVDLAETRYDKVAEGFACHGELVTHVEQIRPAVTRALASGLPSCINIIIDGDIMSPFTEALLGQKKKETDIMIPYYERIEADES